MTMEMILPIGVVMACAGLFLLLQLATSWRGWIRSSTAIVTAIVIAPLALADKGSPAADRFFESLKRIQGWPMLWSTICGNVISAMSIWISALRNQRKLVVSLGLILALAPVIWAYWHLFDVRI